MSIMVRAPHHLPPAQLHSPHTQVCPREYGGRLLTAWRLAGVAPMALAQL